jgi:L-lactate dehydrogenase complex protein LldG
MESRAAILQAIRAQKLAPAELPPLQGPWIEYADRGAQFAALLAAAGGRCLVVRDVAELNRELAEIPAYSQARKVFSQIPGVGAANVALDDVADPHLLKDLDFAILPGEFGVAESGAVWVTGRDLKHRVVYFIAQHLALVIPIGEIVDNLHQAYERLTFSESGFGAFISGPSKTADIEQSLVIGAHGPRSLTVFVIDPTQTSPAASA